MVILTLLLGRVKQGIYRCVLPDKDDNDQSTYIGVYREGAGEWYMHTSSYVAKR